jgi:hypothetical protein
LMGLMCLIKHNRSLKAAVQGLDFMARSLYIHVLDYPWISLCFSTKHVIVNRSVSGVSEIATSTLLPLDSSYSAVFLVP